MHIALIREPESTNGHTWEKMLNNAGHTVHPIESRDDYISANLIDVCLPLTTVYDFTQRSTGRYDMAIDYEASGVTMVNKCASIDVSSDKLKSYCAWQKAELSQPVTYSFPVANGKPRSLSFPMIFKPVLGHSGENVYLVHSLEEASVKSRNLRGPALLQEYIPKAQSIRVIASKDTIFSCYERILPGAIAANVSQGATRHHFSPTNKLKNLAKKMVATLGGGLMGVDVLEKDGKYYALEANVPFGFDTADYQLHARLVDYISSLEPTTKK